MVKETCLKILNVLDCELPEHVNQLSILLTDDAEIKRLNRRFRKKDKSTDVLSFSQLEGVINPNNTLLGDIVISLETTKRQAGAFKVSSERELLRLLIHGILHLAGYDHEDVPPAEMRRMRRMERKIGRLF